MGLFDRIRENRATAAAERQERRMSEAFSAAYDEAMLNLLREDIGWINLNNPMQGDGADFPDYDRQTLVRKSRNFWQRDPMTKQAVRLYTSYALGRGVTIRHKNKRAQARLDAFLNDKLNKKVMGKLALRKLSNRLLVDGELFLAVITANKDRPQVRRLEALAITEIVTNPADAEDVWYYKRETPQASGSVRVQYYRDCNADWGGLEEIDALNDLGQDKAAKILANLVEDVQVVHITINTLGQRGYPLITASIDWSKSLREFMQDRATITKAAAKYAFKKTFKGGADAMNKLMAAQQAGQPAAAPGNLAALPGQPGGPPRGPIPGSTLYQNGAIDTEQFKFDTQAGNAEKDGRMIGLQFLRGVGMSEQYFSDASTGNLATATAMERPVELTLSEYQEIFVGAIEAVCEEVLEALGYKQDGLEVITPPLLNVDAPNWLQSVATLLRYVPALNIEAVWREILAMMAVEDIDAAIQQIKDVMATSQAPDTQTGGKKSASDDPEDDDPDNLDKGGAKETRSRR